jgi:hypothetical protein
VDAESGRVGRVASLTVRGWLAANMSKIRELPFVLVSSIDSERQVSTMPWVEARRRASPTWAHSLSPLVISGASTIDLLADAKLFTGFDELWIPAELPIAQPPEDAHLVSPRELDAESPTVFRWLSASQCRLGVGDGYGLNYVRSDPALARHLGLD